MVLNNNNNNFMTKLTKELSGRFKQSKELEERIKKLKSIGFEIGIE